MRLQLRAKYGLPLRVYDEAGNEIEGVLDVMLDMYPSAGAMVHIVVKAAAVAIAVDAEGAVEERPAEPVIPQPKPSRSEHVKPNPPPPPDDKLFRSGI